MKIIAFIHKGTNSLGLLLDIITGFEELGHEVIRYDIQEYLLEIANYPKNEIALRNKISIKVEKFILDNRIEFAIGIWSLAIDQFNIEITADGEVIPLLEKLKIPTLCYWWDVPYLHKQGAYVEAFHTGIFEKKYQIHCNNDKYVSQELTEFMNFKNVLTLPFAVNPKVFKPIHNIKKEYDIVFFSGGGKFSINSTKPTILMLEELNKVNPDINIIRKDLALSLKKEIRAFAKTCPSSLQQQIFKFSQILIEKRLQNKYIPIYKIIKENKLSIFSDVVEFLFLNKEFYIKLSKIIRSIENSWYRDFTVAYLYKHFKCLILGSVDYTSWGLDYKGDNIPQYSEQSKYYSKAMFGLNLVRWEKDYCVNQKIFEIMASKCCCLQEYRDNVNDLFDIKNDLVVFRTPYEAKEKLDYLFKNKELLNEITENGYRKTILKHTWNDRMKKVISYYEKYLIHTL